MKPSKRLALAIETFEVFDHKIYGEQRLELIRQLNAKLRSKHDCENAELLIKLRDLLVYEQDRPLMGCSLAFLSAKRLNLVK